MGRHPKNKCPCSKSDQGSWMLLCTICKQQWHSSCANIKGKKITEEFIVALEDWSCPWCFECCAPKPSNHPTFKTEQTLLTTAISDTVVSNVTDSVINTMDEKLKEIVNKSLEGKLSKVVGLELNKLEKFKEEIIILRENADNELPKPSPHSTLNIDNPTSSFEDYKENYIDADTKSNTVNFLEKQKFYNLRGSSRSVISFGEKYSYSGSGLPDSHQKVIPVEILDIMKCIESDSNCKINSCLINKYTGNDSFLPEHADDESSIEPGSLIHTISIGDPCNVKFRDSFTGNDTTLTVKDCSLYTMTQSSQCYWKHRIDRNDISESDSTAGVLRYSLTFRCVGDRFKNSTVILGDSNTKRLNFGTGNGSFGYNLPGKRVETFHINDIDPLQCIGYQNIIIHTGINDILHSSPGRTKKDLPPTDIRGHMGHFVSKIEHIQQLCPHSSIIISPLLPTKLPYVNQLVVEFNRSLYDYIAGANQKLMLLDFHCFLNYDGILDTNLGVDNPRDKVHLGVFGVRLLAKVFREQIHTRGRIDGRLYSSVLYHDNVGNLPFTLS